MKGLQLLRIVGEEIPDIFEECCCIVRCPCGAQIELSQHVNRLYLQGSLMLTCPNGHKLYVGSK